MSVYKRLILVATIAAIIPIVAVSYTNGSIKDPALNCMTQQQVIDSHARSKDGISLTCNEAVMQRNLERLSLN